MKCPNCSRKLYENIYTKDKVCKNCGFVSSKTRKISIPEIKSADGGEWKKVLGVD